MDRERSKALFAMWLAKYESRLHQVACGSSTDLPAADAQAPGTPPEEPPEPRE
jgi:hypothetical protein